MKLRFPTWLPPLAIVLATQQGWVGEATLLGQEGETDAAAGAILERMRDAFEKRGKGGRAPVVRLAAGTEKRSILHDGVERRWLLHLPNATKPEKPVPLVLALHGAWTNGAITEGLTGLSALSDGKGFLAVYPDADPSGGAGVWDFWTRTEDRAGPLAERLGRTRDDNGFLLAVIDRLVTEKLADPKRVYLTGISNGAFMTNRLAIEHGDRFAAIAPVAGTLPKLEAAGAAPSRAMPVLYFHGTADRLVGYDGVDFISGGAHSLGAEAYVKWWAEKNGRAAEPFVESPPDRAPEDGCTVERRTWAAGDAGAPVVFYRIEGGGHTWPGGSESQPERLLGKVSRDIDASALMWEFFARFSLP
ncbi:MAG: prolyl oligopeptidase family serine peptidase [Verrucomicrobiae bacterium]|nr:prolyl oligopeptidase family serine peptidase [Verrucomicrobiae bacterium]